MLSTDWWLGVLSGDESDNKSLQRGGVGLMDMREIFLARIVTTNTARIDLPIWLRSEPY